MSERLTRCPACKSLDVRVVKLLNPETHDQLQGRPRLPVRTHVGGFGHEPLSCDPV